MPTTTTRVHIRWMIGTDRPAVLRMDQHGTPGGTWSHGGLTAMLAEQNVIGLVCENSAGEIVGWMVYELNARSVRLHKLVVRRDLWGNGIGSTMLEKVVSKAIHTHRRERVVCDVPEGNLAAQCWLRANGWECVMVGGGVMEFEYTPEGE